MLRKKIVYIENIYKFTLDHFLIGHVAYVLTVENVIRN